MLVSLLDRRLSGSLVIQDPVGRKCALTISDGVVVKVRPPEPVARLGDLLVEIGAIDVPTLERGLRLAKQANVALGQGLLRAEAIDPGLLDAALAEQLTRRVVWIAGLAPETRYGFYAGADYLGSWGAGEVANEPLALIWRTAREHANAARVDAVVGRLASRRARLHPDARVERFQFDGPELTLLGRLRGESPPISALLAMPELDPATVARLVYVLALTRHLDLGDGRAPVGASAESDQDRLARAKSGLALSPRAGGVPAFTPSMLAPARSVAPSRPALGVSMPPLPPGGSPVVIPDGAPPASTSMPVLHGHAPRRPLPPPPNPPRHPGAAEAQTVEIPPYDAESAGPVSVAPSSHGVASAPPPSRLGRPVDSGASDVGSRRDAPTRTSRNAPAASARVPAMRPDPLEWRLNAKLGQCERRDFYGLLEVDRAAPIALIQATYVKLAKVWHPDKLPASMAHRREDATRLFAKLSEARRVLCDTDERARFDREQTTGESEEATVARVVDAANEFRRAEMLARRNDFAAAIPLAEAAYKNDDEQPEYAAFYAFVVVQSGAPLEPKRINDLLEIVEDAVNRDPENVRVRLYRAFVLKRAGRIDDAQRDFRFVARNDRRNVDAMREIRLYNLRKDKEKQGSFLGGLFGRPSTGPKSRR
jgi:hypothetical protein